ncbi:hypothetical protein LPB79_13105 [Rhizobium sp. T136]|uniref:hypothetical protein n=1 Tax=Rhizobium sp. T136 TaxID=555319 RepID=UPI001E4DB6C8|nr:hypothetical protein [Rhizobium sp. T136]UFS83185.1 hypothetical protein LPB79_13105 [Rhizobium sp. T136]
MTQKLLDLFREPYNMDTMQIARHLGKSEAWVYAAIHRERCLEKGDTAHEDHKRQRRERQRDHRKEYLQKMAAKGKRALVKSPGAVCSTWVPA